MPPLVKAQDVKAQGLSVDWRTHDALDDQPRTLPTHADCRRHRLYLLTCGQFESLLIRSHQRCELCGLPPHANVRGKLYIDHDHAFGMWAVRGLLCLRCNLRIARRPDLLPGLADYLADAWFLGVAGRLGFALETPIEPPAGTRLVTPRGQRYLRAAEGWRLLNPGRYVNRQAPVVSWAGLVHTFGAHNLREGAPA